MGTPAPSIPDLILTHGVRNTILEMPMSPTTLKKHMADPGGFTMSELTQLVKLVGEDFLTLVKLVKQ